MWIEILAAAFVGLSLLWLVFEPLFTVAGARPADAIELDALEDLEDTRSGVALAALKEIEFDRETGKLSDGDYAFLKQKYTVEALTALRNEEVSTAIAAPAPPQAATLRDDGCPVGACAACGAAAAPGARFCPDCGASLRGAVACAKCGSEIPGGSRFCAACGGRVAA